MGGSVEFVTWDGAATSTSPARRWRRLAAAGWRVRRLRAALGRAPVRGRGCPLHPPGGRRPLGRDGHGPRRACPLPTGGARRGRRRLHAPRRPVWGGGCGHPGGGARPHALRRPARRGAPLPMGMAASPAAVYDARAAVGLCPVAGLGGLLDACARCSVTCPPALDLPLAGGLAANVRYVGAALEGPAGTATGRRPRARGRWWSRRWVRPRWRRADRAGRARRARRGLPVRVLATLGAHLDPGGLRVPANAVVGPDTCRTPRCSRTRRPWSPTGPRHGAAGARPRRAPGVRAAGA